MSAIYYVIRSYLETDAMTKARYIAEEYMKDYIKENRTVTNEEVKEIVDEYDRINRIGIPAYNFLLINNSIIKIMIYTIIAIILNFFR